MSIVTIAKKKIIFILVTISILFTTGMSFAYWASSIGSDSSIDDELVDIGDWGIPIFTAQEFYDFATRTTSVAGEAYYVANDIDFTGFTWTYLTGFRTATFYGTLNGNHKTLSNLTITNTSTSWLYTGIFPRINGATIYDLTLDNVNTVTSLSGTTQRSGIISGNAWGGTNTISNITLVDCGSQGNSSNGVGGLVGSVTINGTVVNVSNIKATNLKIFNISANVGGLVGRIGTSGARVNMNDIDFQGEIFSNTASGYSGGLIGHLISGGLFSLNRAIVEAKFQNTLVTNATYYLKYSARYLGGFIGRNQSALANVQISYAFFTGSLYNNNNTTNRNDVGTISGLDNTQASATNTFYAYVAYRTSTGTISYTQTGQTGQMSTVVVTNTAIPTQSWWTNTFYPNLYAGNTEWQQTPVTGRPYLT